MVALARPRRSGERPDAWQYVLRAPGRYLALKRARPGKPVSFRASRRLRNLVVTVRPVVAGRALRGKARSARVRR